MDLLTKKIQDIHFQNIKKIFEKTCNNSISIVSLDDIPKISMNSFEGYSARFIPLEDYTKRNFKQAFKIESDDYTKTFVVTQSKKYDSGTIEEQVYLSTMDNSNNQVGHAEIRYNPLSQDEYFKNKPFAGFTSCDNKLLSEDEFFVAMRLDMGLNQLNMMNGLSCALYGWPLYSDTITLPDEKPIWKHLLKNGQVKLFKEGEDDRFVFTNLPLTKYSIPLSSFVQN